MDKTFIGERITKLRMEKGISEYKLSRELGHSKNYIQNISAGKSLPSVEELLYICEYFNIHPKDFFNEGSEERLDEIELHNIARTLSGSDLKILIYLAKSIQANSGQSTDKI